MKSSKLFLLLLGYVFLSVTHAKHHHSYHKRSKHHDEKELRRTKRHLENNDKKLVKVRISPIVHSIRNKRASRPYVTGQVQDVQIQIKLKSMWNEAMWNKYSPQYRLLAGNIIDAVTNELIDNRNFVEAAVLKLRPSSWDILIDLSIKFFKTEIDPVHYLEGVVSSGWISGLEVFSDYFKLLKIINGNEAFPAWNYPKGLRLRLHPAVLTKVNAVRKVKEKPPLPTNYKELKIAFTLYQRWKNFYQAPFSPTYSLLSGNINEALSHAFQGSPKFLGSETIGFRENQQGQVIVDLLVRFTDDENYPAQKLKMLVATGSVGGTPVISDSLEIYEINNITSDQPMEEPVASEEFSKPHSDADVSQGTNDTEKAGKNDSKNEQKNPLVHPKIEESVEPIYPLTQKQTSPSNVTRSNATAASSQGLAHQSTSTGAILALRLERLRLIKETTGILAHHEPSHAQANQTQDNVVQETSESIFPQQTPIADVLHNDQVLSQMQPSYEKPKEIPQQGSLAQQQQQMQQQQPNQIQLQSQQQSQQKVSPLQHIAQSTPQQQQSNWSSSEKQQLLQQQQVEQQQQLQQQQQQLDQKQQQPPQQQQQVQQQQSNRIQSQSPQQSQSTGRPLQYLEQSAQQQQQPKWSLSEKQQSQQQQQVQQQQPNQILLQSPQQSQSTGRPLQYLEQSAQQQQQPKWSLSEKQQSQQQQQVQQQQPNQILLQSPQQSQSTGRPLPYLEQSAQQQQQPKWPSSEKQQLLQQQQKEQQQQIKQQQQQSQLPTPIQSEQPSQSLQQQPTSTQQQSIQAETSASVPVVQRPSQHGDSSPEALTQQMLGKLVINPTIVQPQNSTLEHGEGQEKQLAQGNTDTVPNTERNNSSDIELMNLHEQIMKQQQNNTNADVNNLTTAESLPDSTDTPTLTKIPYPAVTVNNNNNSTGQLEGPRIGILPFKEIKHHENDSIHDQSSNYFTNAKDLNKMNALQTAENLLSESSDNDTTQNSSLSSKSQDEAKQKYDDQKTITTIVSGIIGERMQHYKTKQIQFSSTQKENDDTAHQNAYINEIEDMEKNKSNPSGNEMNITDHAVTGPSIQIPAINYTQTQNSSESTMRLPIYTMQNTSNEITEPITYSITYPRVSENENKSISYPSSQVNNLPITTAASEPKPSQEKNLAQVNSSISQAVAPWPLATPSMTEQKKPEYIQKQVSTVTQPLYGQLNQNAIAQSEAVPQTSALEAPAKVTQERPAFEFHQKPHIYTPSVEIYKWPPVVVPAAMATETTAPPQGTTPDVNYQSTATYTEHIIHGKITLQQSWHPLLENHESVPYRILTQIVTHSIEESYSLHQMKVSCQIVGLSKATHNVSQWKSMEKVSVRFDMKYFGSQASILTVMKNEIADGDIGGLLVYPDSFSAENETLPTTSPEKQLVEQTSSSSPVHQVVATSPMPVGNTVEFKPENSSRPPSTVGNINSTLTQMQQSSKEPTFEFVTAPKDLPKSCEEIRDFGIGNTDGQYVLEARPGCHLSVICQNMEDKHPKEFLGGPNKSQWEMYPYAVLIKISSHDKENVPEKACLEHSDDGKQLLEQIYAAKGKQPVPSIPWKTNVKRLLDGRRRRALNNRPAVVILTKDPVSRQEYRHPRALRNHDADWGVL